MIHTAGSIWRRARVSTGRGWKFRVSELGKINQIDGVHCSRSKQVVSTVAHSPMPSIKPSRLKGWSDEISAADGCAWQATLGGRVVIALARRGSSCYFFCCASLHAHHRVQPAAVGLGSVWKGITLREIAYNSQRVSRRLRNVRLLHNATVLFRAASPPRPNMELAVAVGSRSSVASAPVGTGKVCLGRICCTRVWLFTYMSGTYRAHLFTVHMRLLCSGAAG